jgi:RNA polymerase sigma-70 factor (ECF subfamily)
MRRVGHHRTSTRTSARLPLILRSTDDARLVRAALESIEFERRTVLVAFEMDDVPMKTIAEAMGIPLFTAYSRLRLAREDFRVALGRLERQRGRS